LNKKRKKYSTATHEGPDLDVVASFALLKERYGLEMTHPLYLKGGDEVINNSFGVIPIDRGQTEFDHHGKRIQETSAWLVAKKLGILEERAVQQLLSLVKRSDLQGISLPLDLSDLTKCVQRNQGLSNQEKLEIGIRAVEDTLFFRRNSLQRDNQWIRKIISDFTLAKEIISLKIQRYCDQLKSEKFERAFDVVEIGVAARKQFGKKLAEKLVNELLEFVYQDSVQFFMAKKEIKEKAMRIMIKGKTIIACVTDNTKFNPAARTEGALVIIQRNTSGHTQISFDTKRVNPRLPDTLVSLFRLEELLIQEHEIPNIDLRRPGKISEVPEWYFYCAPQIGRKKPGRFILNGSLTATDIPVSQIPLETLLHITSCAVRFSPRFNWGKWKQQRIALHQQKTGDT